MFLAALTSRHYSLFLMNSPEPQDAHLLGNYALNNTKRSLHCSVDSTAKLVWQAFCVAAFLWMICRTQ